MLLFFLSCSIGLREARNQLASTYIKPKEDPDGPPLPLTLRNIFVNAANVADKSGKVFQAIAAGDESAGLRLAQYWATSISKLREGDSEVSDEVLEASKTKVILQDQKLKDVTSITKSMKMPQPSSTSKSTLTHTEKHKVTLPTTQAHDVCDPNRFQLVFALNLSNLHGGGLLDIVQNQLVPNISMQRLHSLILANASSCLFILSGIEPVHFKNPHDTQLLGASNVILLCESDASHTYIPDFMRENLTHLALSRQTDVLRELGHLNLSSKLRHLDLSSNGIEAHNAVEISQYLMFMKELQHLDLSNNGIGDPGATQLSLVLASMDGLKYLDLSSNSIGAQGAVKLSPYLVGMKELRHLDWSSNDIGDAGAMLLGTVLPSMDNLRYLNLSSNNIGAQGAVKLSPYLVGMKELRHLDWSSNDIGDAGAMILGTVLPSMDNLRYLNLSGNSIGAQGALELLSYLVCMKEVRHLDLSRNDFGDAGAMQLCTVLPSMDGLRHFDLSSNNIGAQGAVELLPSLVFIKELQHLDLSSNDIGDAGAIQLGSVLPGMEKLRHLDLSSNNIGDQGTRELAKYL